MPKSAPIRMRTETFFGFITLEIPDCWDCSQKPGELLGCFEEDRESGTVWINYNLFSVPELVHGSDAVERHVKGLIEEIRDKLGDEYGPCALTGSTENCSLSYSRTCDDDDGTPLRTHSFHHIISPPGFSLLAHLTLIVPVDSMRDVEFAAITERMLEQIKSPKIDVEAALKQNHI